MPRNDRSDSLSVRGEEDPRRVMKGMQQELEREFGWSEATDTGGVEHQSSAEREGVAHDPPTVEHGEPVEPRTNEAEGDDGG